eukprot:GFUD01014384.1.p1 GENE.GFUD01014384.1~~GFUD01014384.1.p1  ORF type:complete len:523 (+),score=132.00 GFUD01014384.1:67-1569(+)
MGNKSKRGSCWAGAFFFLLVLPAVFTSPLVNDLLVLDEQFTDIPFTGDFGALYNEQNEIYNAQTEASVGSKDLCEHFLKKVDSYLAADSMKEDFNDGKPTLLTVLTKVLPETLFGMKQINKTDIREAVATQFCPEIEFKYYLEEKMGSIARKIAKIWKADKVGDIIINIQEIGVELTQTMENLAKKVNETEEYYTTELKKLYKAATVIGPKVTESIKAIGRIESEARKTRWALKSLGQATVRRCQKILRALENLINGTTSQDVDMKRMLRYTANLLQTSHSKLRESITSYENMRRELEGLVVDLNSHDEHLNKISKDVDKEYSSKMEEGVVKVVAAGAGTALMAVGTVVGLADGQLGWTDVIGPGALAVGVYNLVADSIGMGTLKQVHSDMSSDLSEYRNNFVKYIKASEDLKGILELEEVSAREWFDIVKEIQADFGSDLGIIAEALDDEDYLEDLIDAKAIFGLLQESAQDFLDLLAEKEEKNKEIHILFRGDLGDSF